ncbi:MAG: anthranilate synthase component II [Cellulosilyticaceae bacterium]
MILIIDNYDSFTYNLYQYVGEITGEKEVIKVILNDAMTLEEIKTYPITRIIISPGPKYPKDAGISKEVVAYFTGKVPILGVCLGHQVIGECFGANVGKAKEVIHGKATPIVIDEDSPIFRGLPHAIEVGRYHSLVVKEEAFPEALRQIAVSGNGEIMGIAHNHYPVYGLQFHPESILTPCGKQILANFLEVA